MSRFKCSLDAFFFFLFFFPLLTIVSIWSKVTLVGRDKTLMEKPHFRPFLQPGIFNKLYSFLHPSYGALCNKGETLESFQVPACFPGPCKLLLYFSMNIAVSSVPPFLHLPDLSLPKAAESSTLQAWEGKLTSWLDWVHACQSFLSI